jgi:capsular polysaccharide export protein
MTKRFLILQGPPSPFAKQLGEELSKRGNGVVRINFCFGDWLYWHGKNTLNFRGQADEWPKFLKEIIKRNQITDILYYADRLPYHCTAQHVADTMGIRAISYEFGYLRPDWLILERGGQSIYSHFPRCVNEIRMLAENLPTPNMKLLYPYPFYIEAANEVLFNLGNYFLWFVFPNYDTDKYYNPLVEYLSYIPRLIKGNFRSKKARQYIASLEKDKTVYFLVPLQMQNDYQIRKNSQYGNLQEFIEEVILSFKEHAPDEACLVFKKHPLDSGIENWARVIERISKLHDLLDRCVFLDGGDLLGLLKMARGVVTVNSTTGLHALQLGTPVKAMGIAVYDIDDVTDQAPLDTFWSNPLTPDRANVEALVKLLAYAIHTKGNFYTTNGRAAAVDGFAARLLGDKVNDGAFVKIPPRILVAKELGIEIDR